MLTSWAGANAVTGMVAGQWALSISIATILFLVLIVAGIYVQARQMKAKK